MTQHYNRKELKARRRQLRQDMTHCEEIAWTYLRERRTKNQKFRRQYSIDAYVIDFYCPQLKLAVEIDGEIHELAEQKEYDRKRQKYLEEFGITFIRIRNEDLVVSPNREFDRIEKEIDRLLKLKNTSP